MASSRDIQKAEVIDALKSACGFTLGQFAVLKEGIEAMEKAQRFGDGQSAALREFVKRTDNFGGFSTPTPLLVAPFLVVDNVRALKREDVATSFVCENEYFNGMDSK